LASIVNSITGGNPNFTPERPNLVTTATLPQVETAYAQTQQGIEQQQQFLNALQAQNGAQNQTNVFNQMQGIADGTGPNPAMAMLNNQTGANIAAQSAMMAGQRGSSANPALMARQIANQGANTQQQAVGQGAALQAQQSLGALNQMGGIAGQQVAQQGQAVGALNQATQNQHQNLMGSVAAENAAKAGVAANINTAQAGLAGIGQQAAGNLVGNIMGGAGAAATMMGKGGVASSAGGVGMTNASGGRGQSMVNMANGGPIAVVPTAPAIPTGVPRPGPRSKLGQHYHAMATGGSSSDKVPALLSPGEKYLPPQAVAQVARGANPMAVGRTIPGTPKVGGAVNSYANDIVPATLDEGGIVLPRSVTKAKDPAEAAHKFVAAILAKKGKSIPKKGK
jgi:hypothetical protein